MSPFFRLQNLGFFQALLRGFWSNVFDVFFTLILFVTLFKLYSHFFAPTSHLPPTNYLTLAGKTFAVEIAATPAARERGLMRRRDLPKGTGMLFVFEMPQQVNFWMKETLLPLDILYFDAARQLREIHADTPPCVADPCVSYPSATADIAYALELPAGAAAALPVKIGDEFLLQK